MKIYHITGLYFIYSANSLLAGVHYNPNSPLIRQQYDPSDPLTFGYAAISAKKFNDPKKFKKSITKKVLEDQKISLRHNQINTPYVGFTDMQKLQKRFDLVCSKIDSSIFDDYEINLTREVIERLIQLSQFYLSRDNHMNPPHYGENAIMKFTLILLTHLKQMVNEKTR